ncbi:hypothetical protein CWI75_08605 [Kineobactrum sediminis]|uniref:VWFA domain-containing protein n=1 Tax=Kineobactrum sediminis TaxID=1905677 RepID=A0A2N5Y2L9_9GAMM|nr:VWA domain-containing protein [Kineobactrum sediminis]PLW82635.1 hypothetical protein CWI75_08605 [Kineobactrum sediminis]
MIEALSGLHLIRPAWLWCALPALGLALLLWRQRLQGGGWSRVIAPELLRHFIGRDDRRTRNTLVPVILVAWLLACVAAAGPSFKKMPQPMEQVQDALVLVLDLSYSMKATDQAPSRLDRARQKLLDLLAERREGQTALVAYAGDAHVVTPLTDDIQTITNLLPALKPDMMPLPGSDLSGAVELAVELLHSAGMISGRILVLSDGTADAQVSSATRALRGSGATLSVLALGTASGAPMPLPGGGFVRDSNGAIVLPGLDEGPLQKLARDTGGRYRRLEINNSDLAYLLAEQTLPGTDNTITTDTSADTWEDQGYWLVLLLLPLALALFRRGWMLGGVLPLVLLLDPQPATAQSWQDLWFTPDQQGLRALQEGDAERAAELFENPDWAGTAAFAQGDYSAAAEHFSARDSADSWYNRGNALARKGELVPAANAYKRSLELEPGRADAETNLALVEALQQQQQEQEGQQPSPEESQDPGQSDGEQNDQQGDPQAAENAGEPPADQKPEQNGEREPSAEPEQPRPEQQQPAADPLLDETTETPGDASPTPAADGQPLPEVEVPELSLEEAERNQALEQWLRRVPDDPSGLLREKFRYESRKRQQQQPRNTNEANW